MFAAFPLMVTWIIIVAIVIIAIKQIVSKAKLSQEGKPIPTPEQNRIYIYLKWLFKTWYEAKDYKIATFELLDGLVSLFRDEGLFRFQVGNIVDYVILFNGRTVQPIFENSSNNDKAALYEFLRPWIGKGLLVSSGEKWRRRRKLLTPAFHFRILDNFLPVMDEQARILVGILKKCEGKEWIDILPFVSDCSFGIVCETIMGVAASAQTSESSHYVSSVKMVCETIIQRVFHFWKRCDFIFNLTSNGQEFKQRVKYMDNYICQIIEERKSALEKIKEEVTTTDPECYERNKKRPFLDVMLDCYFNDPEITLEDVKHEVNTFMFAEAMRLYPAGPITGRTLSEDVDCCGYTIKKGTECYMLIYQVHRDPKVFPDPDCFDPDRFLPENTKGRHAFSYIPFAAGPRNCIGQKFAMMAEKIIVANIMRNFNIESLDMVIQPVISVVLRPLGPIRLQLKRRNRIHK